jgi:hypothetical protein
MAEKDGVKLYNRCNNATCYRESLNNNISMRSEAFVSDSGSVPFASHLPVMQISANCQCPLSAHLPPHFRPDGE